MLDKMKWDEDADPDDIDEEDKTAFEGLRKVCLCLATCTLPFFSNKKKFD